MFFFTALDQVPEIILIVTRKGEITFANQVAQKMFGSVLRTENCTLENLNVNLADIDLRNIDHAEKDIKLNNRPLQLYIRTIPNSENDLLIVCRKGSSFPDDQETDTHSNQDEDLAKAEKPNEEANFQPKDLINHIPGTVYRRHSLGPGGSRFLNEQVKEIFGYVPSEFTPEGPINFFDLVHEIDRGTLKKKLSDSLENGSVYELIYRARDKFNKEKWICDKGGIKQIGKEKFLLGIMIDITNRMKEEDRILSATLQAEDAERKRISREINDGVQQTLVSSMLFLQSLELYIDISNDPKVKEHYKKGIEMLKSGIEETRNVAFNIMPKSIKDFGLKNTLESIVHLFNRTSLIKFTFYSNLTEDRLNEQTEVSLYRICREAVNNILCYSEASEASIQLTKNAGTICLNIEDNGKGFNPNDSNLLDRGFGISSMKSRAHAIGGVLEIESRTDAGTNIIVELPSYRKP